MKSHPVKHVLLDMDGVLADFFGAAITRLNGYTGRSITPESYVEHHSGVYDLEEVYGITSRQFWEAVDKPGFWLGMEPMPHARGLLDFLIGECRFDVFISSSPSMSDHCVAEKRRWLDRHLKFPASRCMFGSAKHLMARPDALLVDDLPKNCDRFVVYGGRAACVPSNWNTPAHELTLEAITNTITAQLL